ncbi:SDR family NAD(P)-dependent oxidoreductase [Paractinoplanes atraurantiacus]|uniref:NADP-dependent 3-hydroxy acid dehydrogenase YdfG n=1 Tax=Paractinoplanes atraurantiacus TaxID=1036182 RepID=A0A285H480_9ACTN|nr:SDR family NAD(P)-dependent oxidoreductase [Actinoplanes atraurantiacus]SNY30690.1 NADP-dependent 3-hydroxy acid dehydrogenase YdfG [Actinoplanes atraurantiacus]
MGQGTVLISGGAGGIGSAAVERFVAEGWRVVTPVRPGSSGRLPKGALAVEADLGNETDVTAAVEVAAAETGAPLRAVVNLAGGFTTGGLIAETPIAGLDAMLTANLRPTYLLTAAALPHLVAAGGGSVVCVAARAALAPFPGGSGYAISKAAVVAFANAVAAEYRGKGVRCNTILPAIVDTPANRRDMPDADFSKWPSAEEIASVLLFLASDASKPTNGAQLPV